MLPHAPLRLDGLAHHLLLFNGMPRPLSLRGCMFLGLLIVARQLLLAFGPFG